MEHQFAPIPKGVSKERAALIHRFQGQIVLMQMQIGIAQETCRWLRGDDDLPPLPTANDNGAKAGLSGEGFEPDASTDTDVKRAAL